MMNAQQLDHLRGLERAKLKMILRVARNNERDKSIAEVADPVKEDEGFFSHRAFAV